MKILTQTDLKPLMRTIGVRSTNRSFTLKWRRICGPEAEVDTADFRTLREFMEELTYRIVQDCAALTPLELWIRLTENKLDGQDENQIDLDEHWCVTLETPAFEDQRNYDSHHRTISTMATQIYNARFPKALHLSYWGAFQITLSLSIPYEDNNESYRDTMDRLVRLTVGAYQQEIRHYYPNWQTDYSDCPRIESGIEP